MVLKDRQTALDQHSDADGPYTRSDPWSHREHLSYMDRPHYRTASAPRLSLKMPNPSAHMDSDPLLSVINPVYWAGAGKDTWWEVMAGSIASFRLGLTESSVEDHRVNSSDAEAARSKSSLLTCAAIFNTQQTYQHNNNQPGVTTTTPGVLAWQQLASCSRWKKLSGSCVCPSTASGGDKCGKHIFAVP